jgi:hypothetical protein
MTSIKGRIKWQSSNVLMGKRVFLFCFGQKCMSGRINDFKKANKPFEFDIWVDFIQPEYFREEFVINNSFTINEASKILGNGKVKEIF